MSKHAFRKIAHGLKEALLIAKGIKTLARMHGLLEIDQSIKEQRQRHKAVRDMGAKVTKHRTQL